MIYAPPLRGLRGLWPLRFNRVNYGLNKDGKSGYHNYRGGGNRGLAVARQLSRKDKDIVVLERDVTFGQEASSRNSEVIYSGIYCPKDYFPKDYLKTKLCAREFPNLVNLVGIESAGLSKN